MVIPIIFLFTPARYTHRIYLLYGLGFYALAKFCELYDKEIYALINLSGHAIKHVLAAGGALMVLLMIIKRHPNDEQYQVRAGNRSLIPNIQFKLFKFGWINGA